MIGKLRVVNDTFQQYCRYSISILALKVSSIPISIPNWKSIAVDTDTSISLLVIPLFAKRHYQIFAAYANDEDVRHIGVVHAATLYGKNKIKSIQFKTEISSQQKINENCQVNLK